MRSEGEHKGDLKKRQIRSAADPDMSGLRELFEVYALQFGCFPTLLVDILRMRGSYTR